MNKESNKKGFGEKLRKYREKAGLSQLELALACGFRTKAAISKIENGERDMKRDKLQLAADKLGISPLAFFYDDPEDLTIPESNLLSTFRQLSDHGKNDVISYAEFQLQRECGRGKKESNNKRDPGVAT